MERSSREEGINLKFTEEIVKKFEGIRESEAREGRELMEGFVEVMERMIELRLRSTLAAITRAAVVIWAATCLLCSDLGGRENAMQVEDLRKRSGER